jgi:hypothetical protein
MPNLQSRILDVLDRNMREWRDTARAGGYDVPGMTLPWLSGIAEEIAAEVDRSNGFTPPGRAPAGTLRRADVLGPEARMPGEPLAVDPDAPPAAPYPPTEQGNEGP